MLSILAKIGFDWQVALANLVNFIIILFVLRKFAFNPIKEAISNRQKTIDKGLENARLAETDRIMAEELKNRTLREARSKADEIIREANKKAENLLLKVKDEADLLRNEIVSNGHKEIEKKRLEMETKFREKSANMITLGIEKILKEKINLEVDKRYIEKL